MKKFLIIFGIFLISIPATAKGKKSNYEIVVGQSSQDILATVGKPSVISEDKDGLLTWIYENAKQPNCKNCTVLKNDSTTTLIIKFDKDENLCEYSYQTIFRGINDD